MRARGKRIVPGVLVALAGLLLAACGSERSAAAETLATAEFDVKGMTCGGCALSTELALKNLEGVRSADASLEGEGGGRAVALYDPAVVTPERLAEAIREVGFEPRLRGSPDASNPSP